jgi:dipeptide/tripeptide permease
MGPSILVWNPETILRDITFSIVIIALNLVLFVIPIAKIIRRTERSGWWSLLFFTGAGVIVGLWMLALCRWPALERNENSTEAH